MDGSKAVTGRKKLPHSIVCRSFSLTWENDGQVTVEGRVDISNNEMEKWKSVIKVCSGSDHVIGLCDDGSVLAVGNNYCGQCSVSEWKNIVNIQSGDRFSLGVDENGDVFFAGVSDHVRNDAFYYQQFIEGDNKNTSVVEHALFMPDSNDEYEYEIRNDSVCITKYKGNAGEVSLPCTIGGKRVAEIGLKAFENCIDLTGIIIPESVMRIGAFAFRGCKGLRKVLLPPDISDIGAGAFWECKNVVICCDSMQYVAGYCHENGLTYARDAVERFISLKYRCLSAEHIDYIAGIQDISAGNTADMLTGKTNMWISSELSNRGLTLESIQQEDILLFAGTEEENPVRNLIYVIQKVTAYSETENTARISYYTYASFSNVGMTEKRVMNSDTASMQTCSYSQDTELCKLKGNVSLEKILQYIYSSVKNVMGGKYRKESLVKPDKDSTADIADKSGELRKRLQEINKRTETLKRKFIDLGMKDSIVCRRMAEAYRYLWEASLVASVNGISYTSVAEPDYDICRCVYDAYPKLQVKESDIRFNSLKVTECGFSSCSIGGETMDLYGSPAELNKTLIRVQGKSVYPMSGTCGLCQSANMMTIAGHASCEEKAISAALNGSESMVVSLDIFNRYSFDRGGSSSAGREELMKSCGLSTYLLKISDKKKAVVDMYELLINGHGIIVSVDVRYLWRNGQRGGHAISLISASKDGKTFIYNDTGAGVMEKISADSLARALTGRPANVTCNIIR